MKKTKLWVCLLLSMNSLSCSDQSLVETSTNLKEAKVSIKTGYQRISTTRKEHAVGGVQEIQPKISKGHDFVVSTEAINETEISNEPSLLESFSENSELFSDEQDTGVLVDPDNENDVYLLLPSVDAMNSNEEKDTGAFLDADL